VWPLQKQEKNKELQNKKWKKNRLKKTRKMMLKKKKKKNELCHIYKIKS
jgi:hypothetical protein